MRAAFRRGITGCAVALVAALTVATAGAQTAPSGTDDVPRAVATALLAGTPDAFAELNRYLGDGNLNPAQITERATALLQAVGQEAGSVKPDDVTKTIDRITGFASRLLATASVVRFAVDSSFRPPPGALALSFGAASALGHPGFTQVTPTDPRISGVDLVAMQGATGRSLLSNGIAGIQKITLKVPQGDYRLVLMTQQIGDGRPNQAPFGRSLRINGVPVLVGRSDPSQWLDGAVLTDQGARFVGGNGQSVGGFLSGTFDPAATAMITQQRGGALVIEVRAPDGQVQIEMSGFGNDRSYMSGLLLEPRDRNSSLVLQREAFKAILPLDVRLAFEAQIMASAAAVLEQLTPAAGPGPNGLQPGFESTEAVSSS